MREWVAGSMSAQRPRPADAGEIGSGINVRQRVDKRDRVRQFADRILHRIGMRPADVLEKPFRRALRKSQANQPETPVCCRSHNASGASKGSKGTGDMVTCDAGYIRADKNRWPRSAAKHSRHARSEIALPLRYPAKIPRPESAFHSRFVWRNAQNDFPSRITQSSKQIARLVTKPPGCFRHPDFAPQPCFHTSGHWFLDHDEKRSTPHNSRTISRWRIPASSNSGP